MNSLSEFVLVFLLSLQATPATQPANPDDEAALRKSAARYAEAFSRGDVEALVGQYAPDADYVDDSGTVLTGRDAIRKNLEQTFTESPGIRMSIDIKSIRFTKGRAIEIGVATLTTKEGESTPVPYRAIHARQTDGGWLMINVGPDVTSEGATSVGPLQELAWMIGNWRDTEDNTDVTSVCTWTANRRFILRSFAVKDKEDDGSGLQVSEVIGWDPADQVFRSWVFDSDGGFGQNTWSRRGEEWIIAAKGTLADGGRASAVNILHPTDSNSYTWSSTNREVDGGILPDLENVKMVRVPDTQPSARGE